MRALRTLALAAFIAGTIPRPAIPDSTRCYRIYRANHSVGVVIVSDDVGIFSIYVFGKRVGDGRIRDLAELIANLNVELWPIRCR